MQKVNLNLIPGGVCPVVNVSQYDEGRQFQLAIFQGTASYDLTGKTVTIEVGKTDGNGCAYDATDTVNGVPVVAFTGNLVTITTPVQMTACAGDNKAELKISDSTAEIGTLNFILLCEQSALSPDTPISETEIPAIIDAAEANAERAEAAVEHYPYINPVNKNWMVWDAETGAFVDTGIRAEGIDGEGSVQSVNNIAPDVNGNVSLPLATGFSDILPTANGGTGNADGYIRTGLSSGVTAGQYATAEGNHNYPAGYASHTEGEGNVAVGKFSHAGGKGTNTDYDYQTAIGKYNTCRSKSLFAVGNGTSQNNRLTVFDVLDDGRLLKNDNDAFPAASNIATIEMTRTMSAQQTADSYVYVVADDVMYKVTTTIAASGTLTPGTNATAVNIGNELSSISSDLTSLLYREIITSDQVTVNNGANARVSVNIYRQGYTFFGVTGVDITNGSLCLQSFSQVSNTSEFRVYFYNSSGTAQNVQAVITALYVKDF